MSLLSDYLRKRFAEKQVWIIGVGREGISTYKLLRSHLPDLEITLLDDSPLEKLDPQAAEFSRDSHTKFLEGSPVNSQEDTSRVVAFKTPGIPSTHPVVAGLEHADREISSNTQLFFDLLTSMSTPPVTIGITGTKGKSTTTSMIYHVLKENGKTAFLAGNIGTPALDLVEDIFRLENAAAAAVVLEMSSHQLRELTTSPDIAVIQNITPEHLDYYPDFQSYQNAKKAITKYQNDNNAVIYSPKFDTVVNLLSEFATRYTFDVEPETTGNLNAYATNEAIYYGTEKVMNVSDVPLVGKHNLYNTLPSVIVGKLFELSAEQIASAIKSFKGLPHRLEFVAEVNGVRYYNDSQATTPEAAIAALQSFLSAPIHLIAGGSDKGVDLTAFAKEITNNNVKTLVLFPPMGEVIEKLVREQGGSTPEITHVTSMLDAVKVAREKSQSGDIVLLSPACASFGIFKNYQDRGDQFKREVI